MMYNPYRSESSYPKSDAQRNLQGRTHYVDDETLRFHHARILSTHTADQGLLFALVESCAADMHHTKRIFRYVIFDITGTVLDKPGLDEGFSSRKLATKAMWSALTKINVEQVTRDAIHRFWEHAEYTAQHMEQNLVETLKKIA